MASGEMSEAEFTAFLSTFLGFAKTHSRYGAILFVFMDWRPLFELTCAGREQNLVLKNLVVWAKDNAGMGTFYMPPITVVRRVRSSSELILEQPTKRRFV